MIRLEYQILLLGIGFILMLVLGVVLDTLFYLPPFSISPAHLFGSVIIAILAFAILFFPIAKGASPPFESNVLYSSVNDREMFFFEWTNELLQNSESTLQMVAMPLGGIDAYYIHPYSSINDPLVVFSAKYLKKKGRGFICEANLNRKDDYDFPPDIRKKLIKKYGNRFTKCQKLYLAYTGHHDCSISSKNEQIEFNYTRDNRIDNYYLEQLDEIMTLKERKEDKLKKPIILKRTGELDDEY